MKYPSIAQNAAAKKAGKKQAKTKRLSKLPVDVIFEYASQRHIMDALSSVLRKIRRPFALQYGPTQKLLYYMKKESKEFDPKTFRTAVVPKGRPSHMQTWIVSGRLKKTGKSALHKVGIPIQRVEGIIKKMWREEEVPDQLYRKYFASDSPKPGPKAKPVKKKARKKAASKKVSRKKASRKKAKPKARKKAVRKKASRAKTKRATLAGIKSAVAEFDAFLESEEASVAANPNGGQLAPGYSVTQIAPVQFNPLPPYGGQLAPGYSVTQIAPVQFNPRQDGTGPRGLGPRTGRGRGMCPNPLLMTVYPNPGPMPAHRVQEVQEMMKGKKKKKRAARDERSEAEKARRGRRGQEVPIGEDLDDISVD